MFHFLAGFVVALLISGAAGGVYLNRKLRGVKKQQNADSGKLAELAKLTGGLAHEIKNPLSTIKVNLKLVAEKLDRQLTDSTPMIRKIGVIEKETDRLSQILEDFLKFIGKPELNPLKTDINEVVTDMVDFFSPQAAKNDITVRLGLFEKPLICKADADLLKQVILNLFINAQQAMRTGGELIVRTAYRDGKIIIEISDTGPGIRGDKLERVFDAYYSSKPGGTGLGLPTAKKIIQAHGGQITVDSEQGKGTCFTIKLPCVLLQDNRR